jgi:hypothetical protein
LCIDKTADLKVFRNYTVPDDKPSSFGSRAQVLKIMMACMASPTLFDPVEIRGSTYHNSDLVTRNPARVAISEVSLLWDLMPDDLGMFLTIGSGSVNPTPPENKSRSSHNIITVINTMVRIASDTENDDRHVRESFRLGQNLGAYHRFNVEVGLRDIGMTEFREGGKIEHVTQKYCEEHWTTLRDCAQVLSHQFLLSWARSKDSLSTGMKTRILGMLDSNVKVAKERLEEHVKKGERLQAELGAARNIIDEFRKDGTGTDFT